MTIALVLGAGFGLGLFLVVLGLRLAPLPLRVVVAQVDGTSAARPGRLAMSRAGVAEALHLGAPRGAEGDLRVTGRTVESLAAERLTVGLVGVVLGFACTQILASAGLGVPLVVRLVAVTLLAFAGAALPVATLRSVAVGRRGEARVAVGAYLDLVGVALGSGAGVEEAMVEAARIGESWLFTELSDAFDSARRVGEAPWVALGRLGDDLGLTELSELSATLTLVGTEGARARETLLAKARSLRRDLLAESEARALRRTETAHLPLVLQLFGFVLFLLYPAFLRVVTGLS